MAIGRGQVRIRGLLMGPGTDYQVLDGFNPFNRDTRTDATEGRAWNHGSWSGAEWQTEAVVPVPVRVRNRQDGSQRGWLQAHQRLAAAFAAVGPAADVELRFNYDGDEFVMFGRPRTVRPATTARLGYTITEAGFVALDPRIYSGVLHERTTGLPAFTGGLTVPVSVPLAVPGQRTSGQIDVTNAGTTAAPVLLRINGPTVEPALVFQRADGIVQQARFDLVLTAGQWLDVDTAARTALLNGLPEANQRQRATWDLDSFPAVPGTNVVRYFAGDDNDKTTIVGWWRDAWW